ncbi:Caulimovirus viroplasmin [Teratosphaeria destructans]|uniref:Ribonuclease H n=1 Tax=Teratosphaeria destructans TaxID=418781 RepID=A0A9W7W606_9PEZI|nr:Caulimovirus viroplasmin [Teratosphaeria destructans]
MNEMDLTTSSGFTWFDDPAVQLADSPPPAPPDESLTGIKRKRDARTAPKFYAVRVGKAPGIYHTWVECLDQVRGFPKAVFKSFASLTDAQLFLAGDDKSEGKSSGKWYGVRSGRVPGVYKTWQEVLEQITGWKGPKHRGFKTRIEAELYVKDGQMEQQRRNGNGEHVADGVEEPVDSIEDPDGAPAAKRLKLNGRNGCVKKNGAGRIKSELPDAALNGNDTGEYEPGEAPLPLGTEDGFDPTIILDPTTGQLRYKTGPELTKLKYVATRPVPSAPVRVYTDGSSLANGQVGAVGGVGVFFGPGDRRNISEGLAGTKQTNQRAELTAILRALEVAPKDRKIILLSDSNYAIKCVTEWFQNWRRNSWLNASRKPVENKDLITKIITVLESRYEMNKHRQPDPEDEDNAVEPLSYERPGPWERGAAGVKFVWVKGHAKDEGNNAADDLATAGAREAKELIAAGEALGEDGQGL